MLKNFISLDFCSFYYFILLQQLATYKSEFWCNMILNSCNRKWNIISLNTYKVYFKVFLIHFIVKYIMFLFLLLLNIQVLLWITCTSWYIYKYLLLELKNIPVLKHSFLQSVVSNKYTLYKLLINDHLTL